MKRRATPLLVLPLAALGIALAGCGSSSATSSDGATSGETSLSKAEFIARADALCEATKAKEEPLRAEIQKLAVKARDEEKATATVSDGLRGELAETLEQIVATGEAGLSQVEELGTPAEDASQLEAIRQESKSSFAVSDDYAAALENHEDRKAQTIAEQGNAETREAAKLAKQYGFEVCGSVP